MDSEFKCGDVVTYSYGSFLMLGVVIDVYQEGDDTRYLLIEQPEGKPLSRHQQIDAHPARIVQSKHFKYAIPAAVYHYDKQTKTLSRIRGSTSTRARTGEIGDLPR